MGQAPIPTIVGGGIALTPGAVGQIGEYFYVSSIIPPEGTTSPRFRIIDSTSPAQLVMETVAGRGDTVIGVGSRGNANPVGNNADVVIGANYALNHAASGAGSASVVVGSAAALTTLTFGSNVVIGAITSFNATLGNSSNVIIGASVSLGAPLSPGNAVIIGHGAALSGSGGTCVLIGAAASITGGANNVVIGPSASAGATSGGFILIGRGVTATGFSGVIIIGDASTGAGAADNIVALGSGHTLMPADTIVIGHSGGATGLVSGDIMIGHNNLSGLGFSTAVRWGGASVHIAGAAVPAWTESHKSAQGTDINAGDVTYVLPRATGNAAGASWIVQSTTPGASGAALQAVAEVFRVSPGTATQPRNFQITQNKGLWFANQVDGAGGAAGTLTNAPTAGDPAFWLPVRVNGTDYFIPCWP